MNKFKKRKYGSPDGSFLKNDDFPKKLTVDTLSYENQLPIDWHEIKIILDTTVVKRYLNNQKFSSKMSASYKDKILIQKIPCLNQHVFSEKNTVMVKLENPDDIAVDDKLSSKDSLVFPDVPVKQEDGILLLDSLDKNTFYKGELTEPLNEDFQCKDKYNFTSVAALKNEDIFVGEEFKHEESIPSYENVESNALENNGEMIKKKTRSSRKRKRCLECNGCSHELEKKSRVSSYNKIVTPKLPVQDPKTCKSQTPSKPNKPESSLRVEERKMNEKPLHINSPRIPEQWKGEYRVHHCDHCDYKGRRTNLISHLRKKHPYLFPNDSTRCPNCDMKFNSCEEMQRHQPVCLRFLICKFCLVNAPTTGAMLRHMKAVHPKEICGNKGERIVHKVCLNSMTDAMKNLKLTPFGQRNKTRLIKLHCLKCKATHQKMTVRTTRCGSCGSPSHFQCQKCKDTRSHYVDIWKHLMDQTSSCNIFDKLSLLDHGESSNQTSSNETNHDCGICDFNGTTTTQLYEHILKVHLDHGMIGNGYYSCSKCGVSFCITAVRFKKHEELCGIAVHFPCRFCPMTCYRTPQLYDHIAIMHFDELDGMDVNDFVQEALDFKKMVREVNCERFNKKLRNESVETKKDYYHNGIKSMLQPVCIECKTEGTQESEYCAKCQSSLNFLCLNCIELFTKYSVAWDHATRTCENRSFTLTLGKNRAKLDASASNKKLLSCDLCHFKNASKSNLLSHIERVHEQSREIQGRFTCPKCYRNFVKSSYFQQHRLWCRTGFDYTCPFCDKISPKLNVIEYHIKMYHAHNVRCQDTLYEILQRVFENKKAHLTKLRNKFDKFGRIVKRTFAENIKLATFYCPNCNDTIHKDFRYASHTRMCPKCNGSLRIHCKICNRVFSKWELIATHFQVTDCGGKMISKESSIKTHELDHSYSLRQPTLQMAKL